MKKILAIDNVEDNLLVLRTLIFDAFPDMEFVGATSGRKAFELCLSEKPDIVLIDIQLSDKDSFEICRSLKNNDLLKSTLIVVITAPQIEKGIRLKALECGADAFLVKPVEQPELTAQIRAMLRIKEADKVCFYDQMERKNALETYRESEKRLGVIFENVPIGMFQSTPAGKLVYVNPAFSAMYGYNSPDDCIEHVNKASIAEVLYEDHERRPVLLQEIEQSENKWKIFENRYHRKDGSVFDATLSFGQRPDAVTGQIFLYGFVQDITERKLAGEKILHSEKLYRTLVETSPDAIGMADLDGNIVTVNRKSCQIFGCIDEADLKSYHTNFIDIIAPIDRERCKENMKMRAIGKEFASQEYLATRKDGTEFPIEMKSSLISDAQNQPFALISVVRDISQKKKIEDTQHFLLNAGWTNTGEDFFQSLARYLAKSLNMNYICIDRLLPGHHMAQSIVNYSDGNFVDNITYELKGTPCGEVVGKATCGFDRNICNLFPEDGFLQEINADSYAGATLWSSDGKPIGLIALMGQKPIENMAVVESVLNLVTIRAAGELERREAEMELEKSRSAFQNYFENCSIGMSVTMPNIKWIEVNQSLCHMLRYPKEELLKHTWVELTYPDDIERNMILFNSLASGEINQYEMDKRFIRKDGSLMYATLSVVCERNPDGSMHHLLSTYVDVTAKRQAEEEIKRERLLLRTLIDNLPNTVYVKDISGRKILANKADLFHMGRTSEPEIFGKTDIDLFGGEDGLRGFQEDMTVIQTGKPLVNQQSTYFDAIGKQHWQLNSKFPLFNEEKAVQGLVGIGYDITERKQIEDALKSSEELYRNLVERMPDGVYKSTAAGKFVSLNSAMLQLFGYNTKEEMMAIEIKKDLYFAPEERDNIILNESGLGSAVFKLRKKDGSVIWVEDHGWYIYDNQGDIVYHEGILRDVTERQKVEEKMRSLSRAVEQNPASIIITDLKGQIEYVNHNFSELTGYSLSEMLGKNPNLLKSGYTSQKEYAMMWKTILEGGEWHGEFKNIKKTGEEYFEAVTISPIKDENGRITHFLAVKLDITGQKNDQTLIRKLSKAIEQSPVSIIITDADGKIEFVNAAFTSLTQYSLPDVANRPPRIFNQAHISQDDFRVMWNNLNAGKVWKGEFLNRRKDKSVYWEDVTIAPLIDMNGMICNYILIMDDISEKKLMLDQMIAAKEKAEESNRLKSAFLATMNHELRTPLHHIIGFSELIMSEVAPEENSIFAQSIHSSGQSLLSIIEDIFDLALFEQSNIKLRSHTFSIIDHFMECKASFDNILRTSSKHEQIQLVFKPDTHWLSSYVTADRSKINQVITNLFKNAVKFTDKGTIEFGFNIDRKSNMIFFVSDTGIGIPKEKQEIIFDFFRQGDDDTTRVYGGIGIGLSISQKIARILSGELTVVSEPGVGSTFQFTVPVELSDISSEGHPELP